MIDDYLGRGEWGRELSGGILLLGMKLSSTLRTPVNRVDWI